MFETSIKASSSMDFFLWKFTKVHRVTTLQKIYGLKAPISMD